MGSMPVSLSQQEMDPSTRTLRNIEYEYLFELATYNNAVFRRYHGQHLYSLQLPEG